MEGGETYTSSGKLLFTTRWRPLHRTQKLTGTTVTGPYGSAGIGTQSQITFTFNAVSPVVAFRCSAPVMLFAQWSNGGSSWSVQLLVLGAVGTTVVAHVFENVAPPSGPSGSGRFEAYDASGNRVFTEQSRPLRLKKKLVSGDASFTGSSSRDYGVAFIGPYGRRRVVDTEAAGSQRYIKYYGGAFCSSNWGAGTMGLSLTDYMSVRSSTNPGGVITGILAAFVVDLTNY